MLWIITRISRFGKKSSKEQADAKAAVEYEYYSAAQRAIKEQQGEGDIAELIGLRSK